MDIGFQISIAVKLSEHFVNKKEAHNFLPFWGLELHFAKIRPSGGRNVAGVPSQANFHIACRAGILDWDTSK